MIDLVKTYAQIATQQQKTQQDAQFRTADLSLRTQQQQSRQALDQALTHLVTRDAAGLI
jgi:hypothetical protein